MKNKENILHKINSFKKNIIEGKKEKSKSKPKILNNKQNDKLNLEFKKIDLGRNEHRSGTALCISAKRIKRYKHLKITAKNKDNENNNCYLSNNKSMKKSNYFNDTLSLSDRAINKSTSKNSNQDFYFKKKKRLNSSKRNNSSNNLLIKRNKSIGNLTKLFVNKNNEIKKFKENIINNAIAKTNIAISNNINNIQVNQITQINQAYLPNNNLKINYNFTNKNNENNISNNNNISKTGNGVNAITIANYNNIYKYDNTTSNIKELGDIVKGNESLKYKKKMLPKSIYNPLLDKNFLNYNLYNTNSNNNKNYSKDKIGNSKKFKEAIENILIINNHEEKSQKKQKINKIKKKLENEKLDLNNTKNTRKTEVSKKKQELNNLINNNNIKDINKRKSNILYQYLILKGNAEYLIKNCMYHRINWIEGNMQDAENTQTFNFKWKELSTGIDYFNLGKNPKMKQIVNHFEFHQVISNKANLFINLMKYCEKKNLSVFKYVPFTIVFKIKDRRKIKNKTKQKKWADKLEKLKNFIQRIETKITNYNDIGKYYTNEEYIKDKKNREEFEYLKQLKKAKKEDQKKSEEEKYKGQFEVYSDIFPRLKRAEKSNKNKEQTELKEKEKEKEKKVNRIIGSNTLIEIPETHFKGRNMWVLKAVNLNRGMCIRVVNSFQQMEKVINKFKSGVDYSNFTLEKIDEQDDNNENDNLNKEKNSEEEKNQNNNINIIDNSKNNKEKVLMEDKEEKLYNCNKILIQKYIESPLLYKGRKCDMRIWVLLTHDMKLYLFKEGHLKTCSVEYNLNDEDAFAHITNYSFQKHNSNFQKFEKGNEVPFYEFQKFIDETYPDKNYKLKIDLMKQLKEIIKITMLCGKNRINKNNRQSQFEIFGYDFMMDSDFNVFLIEINSNPGIEISSPWIQIIIPRMLDDALRLTIDKVFEPVYDFRKNYKGDYTPEEKKLLTNKEIKIDFNAVNSFNSKNTEKINNSSSRKSTLTQLSSLSKLSNPSYNNKLLDINLELDDIDKNLIKDAVIDKDEFREDDVIMIEENKNEKEEKTEINNNNKTLKRKKKKKEKYISPFPVPGYSLEENLWEFICDLNIKEENKNTIKEKEVKEKPNFTGIKHLLKRKKTKQNSLEKIKDV